MAEEYLDLVNESDEVIGRKPRSEIYAEGLSNFRVVNAFLIHSGGKLWIPRRTSLKNLYPDCLDFSAAGHVESGEMYEEALRREVKEELNIDLNSIPWRILGKFTPLDGAKAYEMVYEIKSDDVPDYNRNDYVDYFWLYPNEVLDMIRKGEKAKSDLPLLIERFYVR